MEGEVRVPIFRLNRDHGDAGGRGYAESPVNAGK